MTQELLNDGEIEVLAPALLRRASKDHVRDVLFTDKLCHPLGDVPLRQPDNRRTEILGKADVFLQRAAGVTIPIGPRFYVNNIEFSINAMRHTSAAADQILSDRIRANTHGDLLANGDSWLQALAFTVRLQALVDDLRDLPQG